MPDAIVLINGQIADVDLRGNFSFQVILDVGFNVFDIVAVDEEGNEKTTQIIIFCIQSNPSHGNNITKVIAQPNAPLWVTQK